jgi:hypothetical protein
MDATTITNETNGVITRVTVFHNNRMDYRWLIIAVLAFALLAWVLRQVFWNKDSN